VSFDLGSFSLEALNRLLVVLEAQVGYRSPFIKMKVEVDSFFATLLESLDRFQCTSSPKVFAEFLLDGSFIFSMAFKFF